MYNFGSKDGFTSIGRRAFTINNNGNVGIRDEPLSDATFFSPKQNNFAGSAVFAGSIYSSYFHYNTLENTYIRGGIDNSKVILNDVPGGKVGIGKQAEAITNITSTLSVFGSLKLPGKIVNANYTLTEDDFTILVNMANNANQTITIDLPPPNVATGNLGHIYTSNNIYSAVSSSIGWG